MTEIADEVGLPADPGFRSTFVAYLGWAPGLPSTTVAQALR